MLILSLICACLNGGAMSTHSLRVRPQQSDQANFPVRFRAQRFGPPVENS